MCNFCLQSSDIRDAGEFLTLSCIDAGVDIPVLQVGVRGASPGNFLEKWMQLVLSEFIFCRLRVDSPQFMCNFCLQSSDIRDAGEFLPLH